MVQKWGFQARPILRCRNSVSFWKEAWLLSVPKDEQAQLEEKKGHPSRRQCMDLACAPAPDTRQPETLVGVRNYP